MRRGYIYTIDAAVAILIIVIALISLFATYSYAPESTNANALTNDIIQLLAETRMSDVCTSTCECAYSEIEPICILPGFYREAPLASVIGEAFFRGYEDRAEPAVQAILRDSGAVPRAYGTQVFLVDETGSQYLIYGDPI